ncbi:MAG TPA: DNA translocase FtsK 4TM domain-containing protein [Candidatus Paceibacterota bacterium]
MGRRRKKGLGIGELFSDLTAETVQGVWAIVFLLLGFFTLLAAFGVGGIGGATAYQMLSELFGVGYFLLPAVSFSLAIVLFRSLDEYEVGASKWIGAILFLISGLGLLHLLLGKAGLIGVFIAAPLVGLFDEVLSILVFVALFAISLLVMFNTRPALPSLSLPGLSFLKDRLSTKRDDGDDVATAVADAEETLPKEDEDTEEDDDEYEDAPEDEPEEHAQSFHAQPIQGGSYTPPPLSLLEKDHGRPGTGDIKANANLIKRTLANFGIQVEIDEISIGPTVTRYAVKPAEGVRLQKIVGLSNNLELALAAHPVRIEAPIPGRSLVGIEVPNTTKSTVGLASLLGVDAFQSSTKALYVALGKDITGQSHFADLARMPHMLIAGATGSGKSVAIHALITSLLYRNSPQALRFIMIDPKRVELTLYKDIPHLLTPVITDPKKTILALKWAAKEMERRYDILETESVRDIESYHANIVAPALKKLGKKKATEEDRLPEAMPYIVIVIDELADIMQAYPRELEAAIVRLAQMSRAVGIHLTLSTQRPSVNVITGLIKANIPARVALQVSSQIDSRTILDMGGAEKLLGAGDMLYLSGDMGKPKRLQSAFISEVEVKKVAKFLRDNSTYETDDTLSFAEGGNGNDVIQNALEYDDGNDDDLYEEAREHVMRAKKASTSYLQRRLRIGYARAARLMDMLEERGVIGPQDGSKARDVLIDIDDDNTLNDNEEER